MSDAEKLDVVVEMIADIYAVMQEIASKVGMEVVPSPRVAAVLLQNDGDEREGAQ